MRGATDGSVRVDEVHRSVRHKKHLLRLRRHDSHLQLCFGEGVEASGCFILSYPKRGTPVHGPRDNHMYPYVTLLLTYILF